MRILFLTPIFPFPADSGVRLRMALTLKVLSGLGEVTILSLSRRTSPLNHPDGAMYRNVFTIPDPLENTCRRSFAARLTEFARRTLDRRPMYSRMMDSSEWHAKLESLRPETFDLTWVQTLGLYELARPHRFQRLAVDLDGADSSKVRRELRRRTGFDPRVALEWLDYLKLKNAETEPGNKLDRFVACSVRDRDEFARRGRPVWVVRNAIPLPNGFDHSTVEVPNSILFVGTLGYRPNREAVIHFVQRIFPLIRSAVPDATFRIVGSTPPPEILSLAQYPNVSVYADVPSVEPYLRSASVVAVPLLNGSGTRLKILEAMSYRKPVVSTTIGAEGLEVRPSEHLLTADPPRDFADCCIRLFQDQQLRQTMATAGRAFVETNHSSASAEADLRRFLSDAFELEAGEPRAGKLVAL